jgi:predicted enzyme related to lactoylglutathione lyase
MEEKFRPTSLNGKVCYIEIPAIDIRVSSSFYEKVFGWDIRRRADGHLSFDDTTGQVSGTWVKGRNVAKETTILIYIMVDDIKDAIEQVIASGGIIVQPLGVDAPELTARFRDPAGNILGLYQEPIQE